MKGVQQAINRIADDLLALAHAILETDTIANNTKIGRNTLKKSALNGELFATISQTNGEDPIIKAFFNNYVTYLEWDRPKMYGKRPPISALKGWAEKNGIPTDADTLWAISYAIWRDGHAGRPIFATMDANIGELFAKDWADDLFHNLIEELNKFFN